MGVFPEVDVLVAGAMAPFFQWLAEAGFHADIRGLRTGYPETGWHPLQRWAATHDRADLA